MIVFDLRCDHEHRFEGWFPSGEEFDRQRTIGLVECPMCGDKRVHKVPSSKIKRSESERPAAPSAPAPAAPAQPSAPTPVEMQQRLIAFVEHVMKNTENVGDRFADEARKIHREEAPERAIRGTATREETEALLEEGVPVLALPIPTQEKLH